MSENTGSEPRVVLFDIYQTLLGIDVPPADAEARWKMLWTETMGCTPRSTLEDVETVTREVIRQHHASARAVGIAWPEVYWPDVVRQALPELVRLSDSALETFLFRHAQLRRTVRLNPGAGTVLRGLADRGMTLGLVSNAQSYTMHELDMALNEASLSVDIFRSDLCFWSFQHGYSKPDPHVFRSLSARLRVEGIGPGQILMVGDREDNDIQPARVQGWRTWRLTRRLLSQGSEGGDFEQLRRFLRLRARS